MTSLTILEQAKTYLNIEAEDGANWKTYVPTEYKSEEKNLPFFELVFIPVVLGLYVFFGGLYLPGGPVHIGIGMVACMFYTLIRSSHIKKTYIAKREPIISQAVRTAEDYVSQRCIEAGVNIDALQDWFDDKQEEFRVIVELMDYFEPTPQQD